jgi:hydrogenase-4 component F
MELLTILIIPIVAAGVSLVPTRDEKLAAGTTILGTFVLLIISLNVAWNLGHGIPIASIGNWLSCDGFSGLILLLISFAGFTAAIFSWGYIGRNLGRKRSRKARRYYARYNLFILSMLAVPILLQVAIVWIAIELTTLFSVFLVSFENTPKALESSAAILLLWQLEIPGAAGTRGRRLCSSPGPFLGSRAVR